MTDVTFHEYSNLGPDEQAALLRRSETDISGFIEKVAPILEAVRTEGDRAVARFGRDLDKANITEATIKATEAEFDAAFKLVSEDVIEAITFGIENIRNFHEEQKPEAMWLKEIKPGAFAGDRFTPIKSAALYVPRGKGSFPSVTMMTSVPAVVAGVPNLAIVTPPAPDGSVDAATLVAARLAGVETVYKVGGAQAVAAVAYGTETIKPALKIVGPGSPWVVAAKRSLSGIIDTGLPAGPSEAIIFADDTVHGGLAALDLLIEAEHGPDSSAYLVTHSRRVAEEALAALPEHWARMTEQRVQFSSAVLSGKCGGIILTSSIEESYDFVNAYAPEHLEILSQDPFAHLGKITEAAEILMGPHTPVSIANFCLGPNAVLPTSRWARTFGPLSVTDFVKRSSIGYVTASAYPEFAKRAHKLAEYEGFSSHAHAVSAVRDNYLPKRG
ncbi:histidinol dehydrogenase [Rhizobium leguminosarum bv. trifolii]|jgi:histidinol dehydrogenase|uniref:Histidinol dehydrogenase n=2 Tax=Rhizobium leguminosarum TaxID=384 RepID=A0A1B8R5I1_RHILT|nr:histidinol dehydrogenase [Rhizobium leguminosarum]AOO93161.1 histidinol dehydrogenase [Rhizobium leguminosarum bv. trifolii]ASS58238.1 histidinol dehydrogenase [Rhizobium leguminosarum bv. viciae]AVC46357.1 histidinol dehydrogenase [Rhizobium leguminosarum bv. viciae]MBA8830929.1 histidinol dehydrogenase [Rhizobium leguminosarum]MBB4332677.1 histidinol dehydrogenase [Rhizobium leguminosarum]